MRDGQDVRFLYHEANLDGGRSMTRWLALGMALLAVVLMQAAPGAEAVGQRFYVKAGATGANDGSSWENAFKRLQDAFFQATAGDEIWVASGVYKPTPLAGRGVSFVLPDGVNVYGSFQGNEASLGHRNLGQTPSSILSGAIGTVADTDNSYHVVTVPVGTGGTLDGFEISDGHANGVGAGGRGGGVLIEGDTLQYTFRDVRIRTNWADDSGGGIHAAGDFRLIASTVEGNRTGGVGGGLATTGGVAGLSQVTFSGQQAQNASVAVATGDSLIDASNVTVTKGLAQDDTGIRLQDTATLILKHATLYSNTAVDGTPGFIHVGANATAQIVNSILWANTGAEVDASAGAAVTVKYSVVAGGCPAGAVCQSVVDENPGLSSSLAHLGGRVPVLAILGNSPAVDGGLELDCLNVDARGGERPFDGDNDDHAVCDMGAFEYISEPLVVLDDPGGGLPEGVPIGDIVLELSHKYPLPVSVALEIGGTASRPDDLAFPDQIVAFAPNNDLQEVGFSVIDDPLDEPKETVTVTLSNLENAQLGPLAQAFYTITDNDSPPTIAFTAPAAMKVESASPSVRIELSEPSGFEVTGRLAVSGSATEGADFSLDGPGFEFAPGTDEIVLPLSVVNDYLDEPDETIVLKIDKVSFATKTPPSTHTYTIKDNDPARFCFGRKVTMIGTPGNDTLTGTPGIDVIEGLNGKDVIRGLGGNDRLCGGPGPDVIRGGPGADSAFGAAGKDRLFGQGGNDLLKGGGGSDTLRGELGRDRLSGGAGKADVCDGGANTDSLLAGHRCEVVTAVP